MNDVTPDPIVRIAMAFMASKHLFVASAIGLFEALASGPATLDELAAECNVPCRTLSISSDAMVSLSLVERDGNHYRNSPAAAIFLAGAAGPDLRPILHFWDRISYGLWANTSKERCAPARGSGSSIISPKSSSRYSRPASRHFRRVRQSRSRQLTTSAGIAGCSMSAAAPVRS